MNLVENLVECGTIHPAHHGWQWLSDVVAKLPTCEAILLVQSLATWELENGCVPKGQDSLHGGLGWLGDFGSLLIDMCDPGCGSLDGTERRVSGAHGLMVDRAGEPWCTWD